MSPELKLLAIELLLVLGMKCQVKVKPESNLCGCDVVTGAPCTHQPGPNDYRQVPFLIYCCNQLTAKPHEKYQKFKAP